MRRPPSGALNAEQRPETARTWRARPHRGAPVSRRALDYYVCGRFNLAGKGGYLRKITMTDLALHVGVAAAPATRKTERTSERNGIGWYSWLGGVAATAIIFAAMVAGQNFPLT